MIFKTTPYDQVYSGPCLDQPTDPMPRASDYTEVDIHSATTLSDAIKAMPADNCLAPILKGLLHIEGSMWLVPALNCYDPIVAAVYHVRGNADCVLTSSSSTKARPGRPHLTASEYVDAWCMVTLLQVCWPALPLWRIYRKLANKPSGRHQDTFKAHDEWERRYKTGAKIVKALPCWPIGNIEDDLRGRKWLAGPGSTRKGLRKHYIATRHKADKKKANGGIEGLNHLHGAASYYSALLIHWNKQMYRINRQNN